MQNIKVDEYKDKLQIIENYWVSKKIIVTKNILKQEDNLYYIPACLLSHIKIS